MINVEGKGGRAAAKFGGDFTAKRMALSAGEGQKFGVLPSFCQRRLKTVMWCTAAGKAQALFKHSAVVGRGDRIWPLMRHIHWHTRHIRQPVGNAFVAVNAGLFAAGQ